MNYEMIWESIKQPLRQGLLFLYSFVLNKGFEMAVTYLGLEFTPEQKITLLSWGTPLVYAILSGIDNFLHRLGKAREEEGTKKNPIVSNLTLGISRF